MAGQCFAHGTQHVQQQHNMTCWAACIAMLVNKRDGSSHSDEDIARMAGIKVEDGQAFELRANRELHMIQY